MRRPQVRCHGAWIALGLAVCIFAVPAHAGLRPVTVQVRVLGPAGDPIELSATQGMWRISVVGPTDPAKADEAPPGYVDRVAVGIPNRDGTFEVTALQAPGPPFDSAPLLRGWSYDVEVTLPGHPPVGARIEVPRRGRATTTLRLSFLPTRFRSPTTEPVPAARPFEEVAVAGVTGLLGSEGARLVLPGGPRLERLAAADGWGIEVAMADGAPLPPPAAWPGRTDPEPIGPAFEIAQGSPRAGEAAAGDDPATARGGWLLTVPLRSMPDPGAEVWLHQVATGVTIVEKGDSESRWAEHVTSSLELRRYGVLEDGPAAAFWFEGPPQGVFAPFVDRPLEAE